MMDKFNRQPCRIDEELTLIFQNVRGLRTKANKCFGSVVSSDCLSVWCLSETWLNETCHSGDYFPSSYDVHRNDRPQIGKGTTRGGGVLAAVPSSFHSIRRPDLEHEDHCVWVELQSSSEKALLGVFYCIPGMPTASFTTMLRKCEEKVSEFPGEVYVLGDFNLPHADWIAEDFSRCSNQVRAKAQTLNEFAKLAGLRQVNVVRNAYDNLLDLAFVRSSPEPTIRSLHPVVQEDDYHPSIELKVHLWALPEVVTNMHCEFDFGKGNYDELVRILMAVDWSHLYECEDVDRAVVILSEVICGAMHECVPLKKKRPPGRFPVWFSGELRVSLRKKAKAHRLYKKTGLLHHYSKYAGLRTQVKKMVARDHAAFIEKTAGALRTDPKSFWRFVKPRYREAQFHIILTAPDGRLVTDVDSLCGQFAAQFKSVVGEEMNLPDAPPRMLNTDHIDPLGTMLISSKDVMTAAASLRPKKSCGNDGIPLFLVKGTASILSEALAYIFNLSLRSGCFPVQWKQAILTPVFKGGSRHKAENYRPIANLCSFAKLFERCVFNVVEPWSRTFLSEDQFGFTAGKSCESNLLEMLDSVAPEVASRGQFDVAYLDLAKAFDMIDHRLQVLKLRNYGMCGQLPDWFASYLSDRQCRVKCNGVVGGPMFVAKRGVPQGSVLGPLLFKIFLNDLVNRLVEVLKKFFADDSKLGKTITRLSDCETLQVALDIVDGWVKDNLMSVNADKSAIISFSRKTDQIIFPYKIGGKLIPRHDCQRDLGVQFDRKLTFRGHIDSMVSECNRYLGVLYRLSFVFKSWVPLRVLYVALIRSRLTYCSVVWAGTADYVIAKLEGVQRRFAWFIHQRYFQGQMYTYAEALRRMDLLSVKDTLAVRDLQFLRSLVHGELSSKTLLGNVRFRLPGVTRNRETFAPRDNIGTLSRVCRLYDRVGSDIDIFAVSARKFKAQLTELFTPR